jgi:hypothetical protein
MLRVGERDEAQGWALQQELAKIAGVIEAEVVAVEGIAYLKVDKSLIDFSQLDTFSKGNDNE